MFGLTKKLILAGAIGMMGVASQAATVSPGDENTAAGAFSYTFSSRYVNPNGGEVTFLAATMDWQLTAASVDDPRTGETTWTFDVDVTNHNLGEDGANRLTIWAFDTDPAATAPAGQNIDGNNDWDLVNNSNVPSGLGRFNVCAKDNTQAPNCSGGGGTGTADGVFEGVTQTFTLSIVTDNADPLTFLRTAVRFQSVGADGGSTAFEGTDTSNPQCPAGSAPGAVFPFCNRTTTPPAPPPAVPVPAGLPLMLTAIGIGAYMRKRARKSA